MLVRPGEFLLGAWTLVAAGWTLLLSVVAHGVTANPLVKKMAVCSAELAA
jgi:hypothetical protein